MADKLRVVYADDDVQVCDFVVDGLTRLGYEVVVAHDGAAALEAVLERRPDIAVLDWMMPKLQGPSVCRKLKSDKKTATLPVVLLSARASGGDIERAFDSGADDYLTKPFRIDELDQVLGRLIRSSEKRAPVRRRILPDAKRKDGGGSSRR